MKECNRVVVRVTPTELAVELYGVPHIVMRRSDIVGVHSWIKRLGAIQPYYFIEYTTTGGATIICDYIERALWVEILEGLALANIFGTMQGDAREP